MFHDAEQRQKSIQACWTCRNVCQDTLFNRCLEMGGRHLEERHVKLMTDCIAMCQMAADFMTRHSSMCDEICQLFASICEACAESCERIGGAEMKLCAEACKECAKYCRSKLLDVKPVAA